MCCLLAVAVEVESVEVRLSVRCDQFREAWVGPLSDLRDRDALLAFLVALVHVQLDLHGFGREDDVEVGELLAAPLIINNLAHHRIMQTSDKAICDISFLLVNHFQILI